ncbi:Glucoamylase (glucan-1,4-alpha-glucosidase), GH15 family [Micromonospora phaseoli]|uniref:Glucoamylase (Glucan-1,4-alpha-glucosidase), GH15 family n=1 Tax=Micromonospora phaseoli TaxID=1144548 RepID=A0A1H7AI94_9ACTN|nr:glycoside hydrolase family 15 protein [Micromonospora phaseoli]PZV96444.1 GH15 family glucan-1,4-alpha-glucosidase [Micromonospora phaseoli]GIJ76132.1 glucoamylase [Micromonospora phaseoli]SEJ63617.1 Glucoamylase (glucan-1,4-alpha-glucosidase), GH15 family [Micromonospora phaseoli]
MTYPPIDSYAFLSDTHTAALVAADGAVEWFCVPHFAGDAVFARLLDRQVGGVLDLSVAGCPEPVRRYLPDTLVLESRYVTPDGTALVHDFLAVAPGDDAQPLRADKLLVRRVTVEQGTVRLTVEVRPRIDHGAREVSWEHLDGRWRAVDTPLWVGSDLPGEVTGGALRVEAELSAGQTAAVLLGYGDDPTEPADPDELLRRTCRTWQAWSARSDHTGFGADAVRHSALVLRGLSFDETGALIAAPTTSLPEVIGGVRNWDYRFAWHRDAALLLLALFRLGHAEEGRRYLHFLISICTGELLTPLVGIHGRTGQERELPHLAGYADSQPVRIGNEAAEQVQFDTYGHILDAALAYQQLTGELTKAQWALLRRHVDVMADRWHEPDHGIWEVRGPRQHYVNAKVMTWVCLDRGIRLAELLDDRTAEVDRWRAARDAVHAEVLERGFDPQVGSFVMTYGSTELDASLLRIPLVGFLPGDDPRMLATIDRVREELEVGPGLLRRYRADDGLPGEEGAFLLCSFELVSALVLAGRREEARTVFDQLSRYAGPLGLYSEQLAPDGTALGNYPQAFTHLALIEAALNLDDAGDRDALHAWADRGGS